MEDTVSEVFRDFGYEVEVTARQGDGGIDVILNGNSDDRIGVQVKRYRNVIDVSQIREFVGALILGGFTKGIFVTTSHYRKGALENAQIAESIGIPINLIDSASFYDVLKLTQRQAEVTLAEWEAISENVHMVPYDTVGFFSSFGDNEGYIRRFYDKHNMLPPFFSEKITNSLGSFQYNDFSGNYAYDDVTSLFYGIALHSDGTKIPFRFENEMEGESKFKKKVDEFLQRTSCLGDFWSLVLGEEI